MCAFHLEQSCQLYLKYTIGKKLGDFPHIHSLPKLMEGIAKAFRDDDFLAFYENNKQLVGALEQAYFEARYYDTQFELSQN